MSTRSLVLRRRRRKQSDAAVVGGIGDRRHNYTTTNHSSPSNSYTHARDKRQQVSEFVIARGRLTTILSAVCSISHQRHSAPTSTTDLGPCRLLSILPLKPQKFVENPVFVLFFFTNFYTIPIKLGSPVPTIMFRND